eukprot:747935-Hanusia_phi.AAC.1
MEYLFTNGKDEAFNKRQTSGEKNDGRGRKLREGSVASSPGFSRPPPLKLAGFSAQTDRPPSAFAASTCRPVTSPLVGVAHTWRSDS